MKTQLKTKTWAQVAHQQNNAVSTCKGYKILIPIRPIKGLLNISLIQNKGYDPPGRWFSPASECCLIPDYKIICQIGHTNNINKIYQKSKKQFISQLQFIIMKKQILLLILAVIATTSAFGQMLPGSAPLPLTGCTNDPTHPLAGVPYDYSVVVNPTGGNFQWWATKDVDFIKTTAGVTTNNISTKLTVGTDLLGTSANYGITGVLDNVNITWSSATLAATTVAAPTFVVVQNDATGTNCANNLKVYPILPINGFTVDIKNMDQSRVPTVAYTDPIALCVADIVSAKYIAGAIVTDYGTNILYFEVVAANFTGGYTPSFQVAGLAAGQTVTSLEYAFTTAFTSPIATTLAAGIYSTAAPITIDPSVTNTSAGVSIYMRLTIANGTDEHLSDSAISLAVNGTNAAGQPDVVNTACNTSTLFEDIATQTLTKRPTVTAVPATGVFVTP